MSGESRGESSRPHTHTHRETYRSLNFNGLSRDAVQTVGSRARGADTREAGWHDAPDGRRFRVSEIRCLHTACWAARCECGHWLTKHDFDADGAYRGAIEALTGRDPLNRRDFAHPPFQCKAARRG